MAHKIIIDNKEIEISEESYNNLKESLIPKKFEWSYPKDKTFFIDETSVHSECDGGETSYIEHARYRKTVENAKKSLLRNKQANRLEALVEQIQGDLGGEYSIFKYDTGEYDFIPDKVPDIGAVTMVYDTAIQICNMLNNGEFSLEGEIE